MIIRSATVDDAGPIRAIYNDYILHSVATFHEQPLELATMQKQISILLKKYPFLVCIDDDLLVGYAFASEWKGRCAYRYSVESSVYIREGCTGQGYGRALYQALIAELQNGPVHSVLAGISLPNDASVSLHEKLGFSKVGHFRQVGRKFDQWLDVGYWQLLLNDSEPGQQ